MGNPTETAELRPTPASQWKGKIDMEGTPLPLPSENVALVRGLSPQAFLMSGMIPDPLLAIIRKSINEKKGMPPKALESMVSDPSKLADALLLIDRTVCYAVVEPQIVMPPPCDLDGCGEYANAEVHSKAMESGHHAYQEGVRDPNVLYADVVSLDDKMFVFQWCLGGTNDLEKFRQEQEATLGSVSRGQTPKRAAKRPARRK